MELIDSYDPRVALICALLWELHALGKHVACFYLFHILFKPLVQVKQFRLLLTSMVFAPTRSTKIHDDNEDNETATNIVTLNLITPRLRHVDITLY